MRAGSNSGAEAQLIDETQEENQSIRHQLSDRTYCHASGRGRGEMRQ